MRHKTYQQLRWSGFLFLLGSVLSAISLFFVSGWLVAALLVVTLFFLVPPVLYFMQWLFLKNFKWWKVKISKRGKITFHDYKQLAYSLIQKIPSGPSVGLFINKKGDVFIGLSSDVKLDFVRNALMSSKMLGEIDVGFVEPQKGEIPDSGYSHFVFFESEKNAHREYDISDFLRKEEVHSVCFVLKREKENVAGGYMIVHSSVQKMEEIHEIPGVYCIETSKGIKFQHIAFNKGLFFYIAAQFHLLQYKTENNIREFHVPSSLPNWKTQQDIFFYGISRKKLISEWQIGKIGIEKLPFHLPQSSLVFSPTSRVANWTGSFADFFPIVVLDFSGRLTNAMPDRYFSHESMITRIITRSETQERFFNFIDFWPTFQKEDFAKSISVILHILQWLSFAAMRQNPSDKKDNRGGVAAFLQLYALALMQRGWFNMKTFLSLFFSDILILQMVKDAATIRQRISEKQENLKFPQFNGKSFFDFLAEMPPFLNERNGFTPFLGDVISSIRKTFSDTVKDTQLISVCYPDFNPEENYQENSYWFDARDCIGQDNTGSLFPEIITSVALYLHIVRSLLGTQSHLVISGISSLPPQRRNGVRMILSESSRFLREIGFLQNAMIIHDELPLPELITIFSQMNAMLVSRVETEGGLGILFPRDLIETLYTAPMDKGYVAWRTLEQNRPPFIFNIHYHDRILLMESQIK